VRQHKALTLVELLVVIVFIGLVVALLLPMKRSAREPERRNSCLNNMKQIGLALHNYHDEHGTLPPAYTVDEQGNRLHSWRALLLPYMEEQRLYESIDLSKPWDDPANTAARETVVESYVCPSSPGEELLTSYVAVVGADFAFSGPMPRKLAEMTDGPAETIAVIDGGSQRAVHWMSPQDVEVDELLQAGLEITTNHPSSFIAMFLDGHSTTMASDTDHEVLRSMLTIAGGEEISP